MDTCYHISPFISNKLLELKIRHSIQTVYSLLQVDISTITFLHHHLFSLEHHLASRLTSAFTEYQRALARRRDLDLDRRLRVLYDAVDDLKEKLETCVKKNEKDFQVIREKFLIRCTNTCGKEMCEIC